MAVGELDGELRLTDASQPADGLGEGRCLAAAKGFTQGSKAILPAGEVRIRMPLQ